MCERKSSRITPNPESRDITYSHFELTTHSQMRFHYPRPLLLLTLFLIQIHSSSANTEILNLTPSWSPRIPALDSISSNWPVLTPVGGQNERRWAMTHVPQEGDAEGCIGKREWCEDDLWLVLDFDAEEWNPYRGFTLRISWPSSVCPGCLSIRLVPWVESPRITCLCLRFGNLSLHVANVLFLDSVPV